eukprot:TRINITY_DN4252_c6_g1_i1.p1 TRINITY_DN4252_c6_g1~~TRINITY_DN4252_c6_g1_i1.p1  ORF type:complete len:323 (+),score=52.24 TRINITY_DN4252_c6_g1_i1:43-969(+)
MSVANPVRQISFSQDGKICCDEGVLFSVENGRVLDEIPEKCTHVGMFGSSNAVAVVKSSTPHELCITDLTTGETTTRIGCTGEVKLLRVHNKLIGISCKVDDLNNQLYVFKLQEPGNPFGGVELLFETAILGFDFALADDFVVCTINEKVALVRIELSTATETILVPDYTSEAPSCVSFNGKQVFAVFAAASRKSLQLFENFCDGEPPTPTTVINSVFEHLAIPTNPDCHLVFVGSSTTYLYTLDKQNRSKYLNIGFKPCALTVTSSHAVAAQVKSGVTTLHLFKLSPLEADGVSTLHREYEHYSQAE